nr:DUF397 domain-containing protein [Kibdelosporangium sp. MJ126-NF4]CEL16673.1 hypothetical protein [Kibdelosporangium sp. MJ126-NF4]CTQ88976.1 hypothetical protein [Kibdelosporangium sp. MJ126-NF4]
MTYTWEWRKSSRSATSGECVEVGSWRKSSCSATQGQCVEVGATPDPTVMAVRDSKLGDGSPILMFSRGGFAAFIDGVKRGPLA